MAEEEKVKKQEIKEAPLGVPQDSELGGKEIKTEKKKKEYEAVINIYTSYIILLCRLQIWLVKQLQKLLGEWLPSMID